jgi:choline dehydrogenase-like flavoprotein
MSAQDKHTLRALAAALADGLHRQQLGTFIPEPWIDDDDPAWPVDPTVGNHPIGGYHHMGTTRMADTPRDGVTDKNCQVFGYSNLFVAGSSVFSTAGWANPTLTIVALAHRLADHLRAVLR